MAGLGTLTPGLHESAASVAFCMDGVPASPGRDRGAMTSIRDLAEAYWPGDAAWCTIPTRWRLPPATGPRRSLTACSTRRASRPSLPWTPGRASSCLTREGSSTGTLSTGPSGGGGPRRGWLRRCSPTSTSITSSAPGASRRRQPGGRGPRRRSTATRTCPVTSAATSGRPGGTPPSTSASSPSRPGTSPGRWTTASLTSPTATSSPSARGPQLRAAPRARRDRRRYLDLGAGAPPAPPG